MPVEVDYGSEYRYRDPVVPPNTLGVIFTQSGETADTLSAQKEIREKGAHNLAIRRGCDINQPRNPAKSVTVE